MFIDLVDGVWFFWMNWGMCIVFCNGGYCLCVCFCSLF